MNIDAWLNAAIADAERRGLGELRPLLETLARSTTALRDAERDLPADATPESARPSDGRPGGHAE